MSIRLFKDRFFHSDFYDVARYLGPHFNIGWCNASDKKGHQDANSGQYKDNEDFIRSTLVFIYQGIGLAVQGIHRPYIAKLLELTADMGPVSIIDFGAGTGQDGLALHSLGFNVSFADLNSQSLIFLLWRLKERRLDLPVYILDYDLPKIPKHSLAICFDVLEHCSSDKQLRVLHQLADLSECAFVNLIRGGEISEPGLHFEIDIEKITDHISSNWPCWWKDYYPDSNGIYRQRLVVYGSAVKLVERVGKLDTPERIHENSANSANRRS